MRNVMFTIFSQLRLCLVAVKYFPENTYFSEMLISGKGKYFSVFGCISENFPENISWCLEKKKENTNPVKYHQRSRSEIVISPARSRDQRRELAPQIAIDGAISRRREVAISRRWSRDRAGEITILDRDRWWYFSWVCVFLFLFQTPENIFRKIFWNATKHGKIFSFSGN